MDRRSESVSKAPTSAGSVIAMNPTTVDPQEIVTSIIVHEVEPDTAEQYDA